MRRFFLLTNLFLLGTPLWSQLVDPFQPTPFRREQFNGRNEDLNDLAFLHRVSYEPAPFLGSRSPPPDNTLRGTAGSTSGDRLYLRLEARATAPLRQGVFAEYRFRRHEDFDGSFSRNLVGLGYSGTNGWRTAFFADLSAEKKDVDTEFELRWDDVQGNHILFSVIGPDAWYNTKSKDGKYESPPFTFFSSLRKVLHPRFVVHGFLQTEPRIRYVDYAEASRHENESLAGGGSVAWTLLPPWTLECAVESLGTQREETDTVAEKPPLSSLDRTWDAMTMELRHEPSLLHRQWVGIRRMDFDEENDRPAEPQKDKVIDRWETLAYCGFQHPVTETLSLEPSLYLSWLHHTRTYAQTPEKDWHYSGFVGKFAPALRLILNPESGAQLTLNMSARLDRMAFGGGNIQFLFPF
jgi:hypothetical protein